MKVRAAILALLLCVGTAGCRAERADIPTPSSGSVDTFTAYVTGYTYYDNTPPRSAKISHPKIHPEAGGVGSYEDPVTVAVGHSKTTGRSVLDFPAGTRFYLPYLGKYFIVEDTCGDGPVPERGPCHLNAQGPEPWLDIWLDGEGLGRAATRACARSITGNRQVVREPPPDLAVETGAICGV